MSVRQTGGGLALTNPDLGLAPSLRAAAQRNLGSRLQTGTSTWIPSYADLGKLVTGTEYLAAWLKTFITAAPTTAPRLVLRGDSTMVGQGATATGYYPDAILLKGLRAKGIVGNVINRGVAATHSGQWLSTYLPADLAGDLTTNIPKVYLVQYGLNDPYYSISAAQTIQNIRDGLALLRGTWTANQTSVILMSPVSSHFDGDGRNEEWHEQVSAGFAQAARDYGCCFIDAYAFLRDTRYNQATGWLHSDGLHPSDPFYIALYGLVADVLTPSGLVTHIGLPRNPTPASGFTIGSVGGEGMVTSMNGSLVTGDGYLNVTTPATLAKDAILATISAYHWPQGGNQWGLPLAVWDNTNWVFPRAYLASTTGYLRLAEAVAITATRVYFAPAHWRR